MSTTADDARAEKRAIRVAVAASRAARSVEDCADAADCLAERVLELPAVRKAGVVCAFVSTQGEPGTQPLIDALHRDGVEVLLPRLLEDFDLDWGRYEPGSWRAGRFGIVEPDGPALGVDAVRQASVIVCPGVGGDRAGHRLGRGGGSYDRAFARADPAALRCLLLYDDEVLAAIPALDHDEPVDVIATPGGVLVTGTRS